MPYCENDKCFRIGFICALCNHTFCDKCAASLHTQMCSSFVSSAVAKNESVFAWESLLPGLIASDGMCKSMNESLRNAQVVGVYFSAHWCPPCRGFTPVLTEVYNKLRSDGKKFEIVFVSSDKDEHSFREYHSSMPWLALPFQFRSEKQALSERFGVEGIPTLILMSSEGEIITTEGREMVDNFKAKGFPYSVSHIKELEKRKENERNELLRNVMGQELKLFGESAQGPQGSRAMLSEVARNDVIALVFGDKDSDITTQHVLPMLEKVRQEVRQTFGENALEVIYVPWEGEASEEDKEFCSRLPFLSLDHSTITSDVREKFLCLFDNEIQVPFIALISGNGAQVLRASALREVYETKAEGYPWTTQALKALEEKKAKEKIDHFAKLSNFQLFENKLISNASTFSSDATDGESLVGHRDVANPSASTPVSAQALTSNQIVGLYFSAHWCGPCRAFTPRLISVYNELKSQHNFEIIFISSDRDQKSFENYFGSMPWLALSFEERALKSSLSEMFDVQGIPTLKFLDGSGKPLEGIDGRSAIMMGAEFFPWDTEQQQRFSEVAKDREAEVREQARQTEMRMLEEQKAQGNGVFERLRGKPGTTTIGVDHRIVFGSFDTVGAITNGATKGKIFYEVEMIDLDEGIQQFGWADQAFEKEDGPTGEGVGDDPHSYGVDGTRMQRWHNGSTDYGLEWSAGDVLGCAADLDGGSISFGLNGNWEMPMGVAFDTITPQGGLYPALTANSGVFCVNLGSRPFKFGPPNEMYTPIVCKQ